MYSPEVKVCSWQISGTRSSSAVSRSAKIAICLSWSVITIAAKLGCKLCAGNPNLSSYGSQQRLHPPQRHLALAVRARGGVPDGGSPVVEGGADRDRRVDRFLGWMGGADRKVAVGKWWAH